MKPSNISAALAGMLLIISPIISTDAREATNSGGFYSRGFGPGMLRQQRQFWYSPNVIILRDGCMIIRRQNGQVPNVSIPVFTNGSRVPGRFGESNSGRFLSAPRFSQNVPSSAYRYSRGGPWGAWRYYYYSYGTTPIYIARYSYSSYTSGGPYYSYYYNNSRPWQYYSYYSYTTPTASNFTKAHFTSAPDNTSACIIYNTTQQYKLYYSDNCSQGFFGRPAPIKGFPSQGVTFDEQGRPVFTKRPVRDFFPSASETCPGNICLEGSTNTGNNDAIIFTPDGNTAYIPTDVIKGTSVFPRTYNPVDSSGKMMRVARANIEYRKNMNKLFRTLESDNAPNGHSIQIDNNALNNVSERVGPTPRDLPPPSPLTAQEQLIISYSDGIKHLTSIGFSRQLTTAENTQLTNLRRLLQTYTREQIDAALNHRQKIVEHNATQQKAQQNKASNQSSNHSQARPTPTAAEKEVLTLLDRISRLLNAGVNRELTAAEAQTLRQLNREIRNKPRDVVNRAMAYRMAQNRHNPDNATKRNVPHVGRIGVQNSNETHQRLRQSASHQGLRQNK